MDDDPTYDDDDWIYIYGTEEITFWDGEKTSNIGYEDGLFEAYDDLLEEWDAQEAARMELEEAEDLRLAELAWTEAKAAWEEETELYNSYMNEYNMWVALMEREADLDLWREHQKGANEAWARVEEQEEWYDLATAEWEYQDGLKQARTAAAEALQTATNRQDAQAYRWGVINMTK